VVCCREVCPTGTVCQGQHHHETGGVWVVLPVTDHTRALNHRPPQVHRWDSKLVESIYDFPFQILKLYKENDLCLRIRGTEFLQLLTTVASFVPYLLNTLSPSGIPCCKLGASSASRG